MSNSDYFACVMRVCLDNIEVMFSTTLSYDNRMSTWNPASGEKILTQHNTKVQLINGSAYINVQELQSKQHFSNVTCSSAC